MSANAAPTPSSSKVEVGDSSGTEDAMTRPIGKFNPEIKAGLTVAPEVVYSPIVPLPEFATNSLPPDKAMPAGPFNPEIKAGLTVAPEVVYSPIVPVSESVTKISPPGLAAGIMQSAAETKPSRTARKAHDGSPELYVLCVFIGMITKGGKHTINQC